MTAARLRSSRSSRRLAHAVVACVFAAPLMASNCSSLGTTIPVKAYADACTHASSSYALDMTPSSGTGRWQNTMGKTITARLVFTNPSRDTTSGCTTARGTAELRGSLPAVLAQIVLAGSQGSWHQEGQNIVVRFGNANRWLTLTLPLDGTQGTYQGGTPAEAGQPAGNGEGTVTQRAA